jgi:hypothetical protein
MPIAYEWTRLQANGEPKPDEPLQLDATRSEARNVPAGWYRIVAVDDDERRFEATIEVFPVIPATVVVTAYAVRCASGVYARDGCVTAMGNVPSDAKLFWTNGWTTVGPVLHDVPKGTYAIAAVVPDERDGDTRPVPCLVHACPPACVGLR